MQRTAAIAGAIVVAGGLIGYLAQPRPSPAAAELASSSDAPVQVSDGDLVSSGAALPEGYGLECPPVLQGECYAVDQRLGAEARAAQAATDAAGGAAPSGPAHGGAGGPALGQPMFNLRDALALSQLNVEGLLREPRSATYRGVWRVDVESEGQWMPAYCGTVSGRNAFGGRAGYSRFVATPVIAMIDGQAGFDRFYRETCLDLPRAELVPHF